MMETPIFEKGLNGILSTGAGSWIDDLSKLTQITENGRIRPLRKEDERNDVPPGTSFSFELVPGRGEVVMAAYIPSSARGIQFSIPPALRDAVREATAGMNATTALIGLADYAMDRLEGYDVVFEPRGDGKQGPVCTWTEKPTKGKTHLTLTAALPAYDLKGRRRISVPEDVRGRIERAMTSNFRFTGVVLALAQWALDDLRKQRKRLIILPAPKE